MEIKISIMLTCYNCEDCIDEAIRSVVVQDMPFEWELLIGDDGSNDRTIEHINKWLMEYPNNIRLFIMPRAENEKKDGTRAAKNRANLLEMASGEYLIFLDGDDCFLGKEKLKKQIEILDDSRFQNCSCVAHNILANEVLEGKKYPLADISLKSGVVDTKKYWKELYFHTNTIVFRKCCKDLMLNEKYRNYLNDNFITYIILQYGQIYYLKDVWAQYNLTGNGLWTGKKRVYGCFRNLILYDLELDINKQLSKESFIRHLYDFRYIFDNYKKDDMEVVKPLVSNLNNDLFHQTMLLYRMNEKLTLKEEKEKHLFELKVKRCFMFIRISHVPRKIKSILR